MDGKASAVTAAAFRARINEKATHSGRTGLAWAVSRQRGLRLSTWSATSIGRIGLGLHFALFAGFFLVDFFLVDGAGFRPKPIFLASIERTLA